MKQYKEMFLETTAYESFKTGNVRNELSNLGRINIFIGPNNSGKSRLLRLLFKDSQFNQLTNPDHLKMIREVIGTLNMHLNNIGTYAGNDKESASIHGYSVQHYKFDNIEGDSDFAKWLLALEKLELDFKDNLMLGNKRAYVVEKHQRYINSIFSELHSDIQSWRQIQEEEGINKYKLYIPILRGLRALEKDQPTKTEAIDDLYAKRTVADYFGEDWEKPGSGYGSIFTGLTFFEDVKSMLLGDDAGRTNFREFEEFIGETFFENARISIIPRINDDVVHIKIGDNPEFPIHQLGDGVQALIILLFPIFKNKDKNLVVFIEEPEQNLHPGFQRVLIEVLSGEEFAHCQFFFNTHSNHFLDLTTDFEGISIFAFKSKLEDGERKFHISNVQSPDLNLLEALGVRNSSVFLSNCTIWVEGITDRIYIRKYLELYQKKNGGKFKEDLHYSFVEYGGGNITHWSFLEDKYPEHRNINVKALCGRLFLIADRDGTKLDDSSAKAERIKFLEESLDPDKFHCWECREIENSLSPKVILEVVKEMEGKNAVALDFEKFNSNNYEDIGLGTYIEENIIGLKGKYKAQSGTIRVKVDFAKSAVGKLETIEDLSDEALKFVEKLYAFIQKNN